MLLPGRVRPRQTSALVEQEDKGPVMHTGTDEINMIMRYIFLNYVPSISYIAS